MSSVSKRSRSCSAACELRSRGGDFRARGFNLRLRLADVFDSRAGLHESQLRFCRGLLGLDAIDRQLHVARVERQHGLPRLHAIAFLHGEGEDAAAHFGREPRFGCFDVPRDAQPIARRLLPSTRWRRDGYGEDERFIRLFSVPSAPSAALVPSALVYGGQHPSRRFLSVRDHFFMGDGDEQRKILVLASRLLGDAFTRGVDDDRVRPPIRRRGSDERCGTRRSSWPCFRIAAKLPITPRMCAMRVGVEARRAFGDLAQHHRRHPRPRLGHAHERFDERDRVCRGAWPAIRRWRRPISLIVLRPSPTTAR